MSVVEKHTPAPWKVGNLESWEMDGTPFRRVYFPRDHLEIQEAHIRGDNCDANARLIAAAPDFADSAPRAIEMLRVATAFIRKHEPDGTYHYDEADCDGYCIADDCESAADILQGALAKSKGK